MKYSEVCRVLKKTKREAVKSSEQRSLLFLAFTLSIVLVAKVNLFIIDHNVRFFLGDSASYIQTALTGWIPPDRSFLYGYLIKLLTSLVPRLDFVVLAQVIASGLSVWFLSLAAIREVRKNTKIVTFLLSFLLCFAPIQLAYERFILTECFTLFVFSTYILIVSKYLEKPKIWFLVLLSLIPLLLAALRVSTLPNVLVGSLLIPILGNLSFSGDAVDFKRLKKCALHLVVSIAVTFLSLNLYKTCYEVLSGDPAGYHSRQGYFLLATVSPLLERDDFCDPAMAEAVFADRGINTKDASLRNAQIFLDNGILPRIERYLGDPLQTNQVARETAMSIIKDHPWAFFSLGWNNLRYYLNWDLLDDMIVVDLGNRPLSQKFNNQLIQNYNFEYQELDGVHSLITAYLSVSNFWFGCIVVFSVPMAFIGIGSIFLGNRLLPFLSLQLLCCLGVTIFLPPASSVRYLHLMEALFIVVSVLSVLKVTQIFRLFYKLTLFFCRCLKN